MTSCERTGDVMGPIANSDNLSSRVSFNHDAEVKRVKTMGRTDHQPGVVEMVEKAVAHGNQDRSNGKNSESFKV